MLVCSPVWGLEQLCSAFLVLQSLSNKTQPSPRWGVQERAAGLQCQQAVSRQREMQIPFL